MDRSFLKENRGFFIGYGVFLLAGLIALAFIPKGNEILFFQGHRSDAADMFFYTATLIFENPYLLLLFFCFLSFRSYRTTILVVASYTLNAAITQILKRLFAHVRPFIFFQEKGIEIHSFLEHTPKGIPHFNGFPSGHASTSFAILTAIAFFVSKPWKYIALALAIVMCISRVYLAAHFFEDVLFGSILGLATALGLYAALRKRLKRFEGLNLYRGILKLAKRDRAS